MRSIKVKLMNVLITGTGMHVPENIVTNEELAARLAIEPEHIFKSSGIRRRRWVLPGTTTSLLASAALKLALEDAELAPEDIDYLLFGTMTPDRYIPGSAPTIQQTVGLRAIPCLDIRAACCNVLYGLQLASALVIAGVARNVALCLADVQSAWLNLSPSAGTIPMLFGDGASALIISAEGKKNALQLLDVMLATDGAYVDHLGIRRPGTEFGSSHTPGVVALTDDYGARMADRSVLTHAARKMVAASKTVLQRNKLSTNDVRWIVPHQANANLISLVARQLNFNNNSEGLISVLEDYGNTSSASMGIALDSLRRSERIKTGDFLLLPAFGAGFTWGAGLCRA